MEKQQLQEKETSWLLVCTKPVARGSCLEAMKVSLLFPRQLPSFATQVRLSLYHHVSRTQIMGPKRKTKRTQNAMCYPSCSATGFSPSTLPHQPAEAEWQEQGIHPLQLNLPDSLPDGSQLIQNYYRWLSNWNYDSRAQEPHECTAPWCPYHMDLTFPACSSERIHEFSSFHRHQLGLATAREATPKTAAFHRALPGHTPWLRS